MHRVDMWVHVPDAVLLGAVAHVAPGEVCAAAATCTAWAETMAGSESWLWSLLAQEALPKEVFTQLQRWAGAAQATSRQAMQLWMCRPRLWGGTLQSEDGPCNPVVALSCDALPCASTSICCAAWSCHRSSGGFSSRTTSTDDGKMMAIGTSSGVLAFCRLHSSLAPASNLRGQVFCGIEVVSCVRAAHGHQLISAVRDVGVEGTSALSAGLDGLVRIWDSATALERAQIATGHQQGINDAVVAPCGASTLLTCGDDGWGFLHDLHAGVGGATLRKLEGHSAPAYCGAWSGPVTCVTGGFDRRSLLWDQRVLRSVGVLPGQHHVYSLVTLDASTPWDMSRHLLVGQANGTTVQWDLRQISRGPLRELRGHSAGVESLAVLPGNVLASASSDGTLRLWDAKRGGAPSWLWTGACGPLTGVAVVGEDTFLTIGVDVCPTVLSLDYGVALNCLCEVLNCALPPAVKTLRQRDPLARHSDLPQKQRQHQGVLRTRGDSSDYGGCARTAAASRPSSSTRVSNATVASRGATGAAHRAFLCGVRHC